MLPEVSRKRDGLPECGAVVVRQGVSDEHPGAEARSVAEIEVNGPRSVFFVPVCVRAAAHLPLGTLFLRPGGGRIFPSEHFFCDPAAVPSAPLNSPSRPYPAPLNTLAPPPPAPQNPRLFCPRPAPGPTAERAGSASGLHRRTTCTAPSRAAEHAGPLPVGAPETSPEGPQHAPESPFRGHLSKSRPRSWVFRGIFRTFGCKWMQKMSFAANNIIRIS